MAVRKSGLCLLLCLSLCAARAQVTVEVSFDQDQFLPGESMPVAVRITNRSGQTLQLGEPDDWLTFSVEGRDGLVAVKAGDPPVAGAFELPSSKMATKRVDLAPYFPISQSGRYAVVASVKIREWGYEVASKPKSFMVIQGTRLWESEVGVPGTGSGGMPEIRRYILQQANYLKSNIRLYLRVTDFSGAKSYKVEPIGNLVSFSRPEVQIDDQSNLHVIFQRGPRAFTYSVFNTDGELLIRQNHEYDETRPRLSLSPDSKIEVSGGKRVLSQYDIPIPKEELLESPATNAPPPSPETNSPAKKRKG